MQLNTVPERSLLCSFTASPSQPDNWGAWEKWTRCHLTCGSDGRVQRKRRCEPSGYSMYCVGNDTETRQCTNVPDCPGKNQIKSSLYSQYCSCVCNEQRGPSPRLSAWTTQLRKNEATVASRWRQLHTI